MSCHYLLTPFYPPDSPPKSPHPLPSQRKAEPTCPCLQGSAGDIHECCRWPWTVGACLKGCSLQFWLAGALWWMGLGFPELWISQEQLGHLDIVGKRKLIGLSHGLRIVKAKLRTQECLMRCCLLGSNIHPLHPPIQGLLSHSER